MGKVTPHRHSGRLATRDSEAADVENRDTWKQKVSVCVMNFVQMITSLYISTKNKKRQKINKWKGFCAAPGMQVRPGCAWQ